MQVTARHEVDSDETLLLQTSGQRVGSSATTDFVCSLNTHDAAGHSFTLVESATDGSRINQRTSIRCVVSALHAARPPHRASPTDQLAVHPLFGSFLKLQTDPSHA